MTAAARLWRFLRLSAAPLLDNLGPRCSANSAAAVGAGYGVQNPMSPVVLPLPGAMAPASNNRAAWLAIGDFLATQNLRAVLAARAAAPAAAGQACAARAGAAGAQALPVGNHGDNKHQQCPGTSENKE